MPKQYCLLDGRPVLQRTLEAFHSYDPQMAITVVVSAPMRHYWRQLCEEYGCAVPHRVVEGGNTRWASVRNALLSLGDLEPAAPVLIHDGARPLVSQEVIASALDKLRGCQGAIPALAVSDSLRQLGDYGSSVAVDRSQFVAVQTPQAFPFGLLRQAYELPYSPRFTDDASVMAAAGFGDIHLSQGDPRNIKITNRQDLYLAEAIIKHCQ